MQDKHVKLEVICQINKQTKVDLQNRPITLAFYPDQVRFVTEQTLNSNLFNFTLYTLPLMGN